MPHIILSYQFFSDLLLSYPIISVSRALSERILGEVDQDELQVRRGMLEEDLPRGE